jgi:hypothetical protein
MSRMLNRMRLQPVLEAMIEYACGGSYAAKMKHAANAIIDDGDWIDGIELAVTPGELDHCQCEELYGIFARQDPMLDIRYQGTLDLFEQHLPQLPFSNLQYLVHDDLSIIATDSLRVGRFTTSSIVWVTPRIALDGIDLDRIEDNCVHGSSRLGYTDKLTPFRLAFDDGQILQGEVCEW